MSQTQPIVAIVDDDVLIQRALARLLYTVGWHAVTFPSAEAFLQTGMQASPDLSRTRCVAARHDWRRVTGTLSGDGQHVAGCYHHGTR